MIIKDRSRLIWLPQLYVCQFRVYCYGEYAYKPDGGGFGGKYGDSDRDGKKRTSKEGAMIDT